MEKKTGTAATKAKNKINATNYDRLSPVVKKGKQLQLRGVMVERDTISRMESGSRFVADFEAVVIAEVLEVPVLWLLGRE